MAGSSRTSSARLFTTLKCLPALQIAAFLLVSAATSGAGPTPPGGAPPVTIPLAPGARYAPESEAPGTTWIPVGDRVWDRFFLIDQSRHQVVAMLEGPLGKPGSERPLDLFAEEPDGPPARGGFPVPLEPKPGWPVSIPGGVAGAPVPVELGSERALAVCSASGTVHLFDAGGARLSGWPLALSGGVPSPPAAGDVDGDGVDEIVVGDGEGWVHVLAPTGDVAPGWPRRVSVEGSPDPVRAAPSLADINRDGLLEVVAAARSGRIWVWTCQGDLLDPAWPVTIPPAGDPVNAPELHGSPAVADLDGDGRGEIIAGSGSYRVDVWTADGSSARGWPAAVPGPSRAGFSAPVVGDLDGDDRPDIALGADLGFDSRARVLGYAGSGRSLEGWPAAVAHRVNGAPALADLNRDGRLDLVVATVGGDGQIIVLDGGSGKPLPGWPVAVKGVSFNSSPVIVDVTGDGVPEVLAAGLETGAVERVVLPALTGEGGSVDGWPLILGGEEILTSSPLAVDLDQDGRLELCLGTEGEGRLHVWKLPTADRPGAAPWPMEQGGPARTGLPPRPSAEEAAADSVRRPVPERDLNPLTTIAFQLERVRSVRLSILSLQGRRVRRLLDTELPAGSYEIIWDGDDDAGEQQPSGIYFYRLEIGPEEVINQLLLLE
ncbi:MAG: hypothetical protein GF355_12360 [Candidatus Eisenbacteria bacterium]|nr:hypothetical protein [Candidatus Eisenbacteria bacterium]